MSPLSSSAAANTEAEALIQSALAASQADDTERALALLAQASAARPQWALPHFLLGSELAAAGRIEAAEGAFANAVLLAPDFAIARYQLGLLQFSSGRAATALLSWSPLLQPPVSGAPGAPEVPQALRCFVRGFAALAQDDFEGALRLYREGLALPLDNPAVAADVRLVIARIEALPSGQGSSAAPGDANRTAAPASAHALSEEQARALIAGYGQQRLH